MPIEVPLKRDSDLFNGKENRSFTTLGNLTLRFLIQKVRINVTLVVYHGIYVVQRTNRKVKCTSTTHDHEEARDRLTHR